MKKQVVWIIAVALSVGVASVAVQAQSTKSLPGSEEPTEKEMNYLIGLCEGCHGPGGVSSREDVPSLAGRDADALFAEIERFYFYERLCPDVPVDDEDAAKGHMSMCDVTNQMSKQDAQALARYFEAQPVTR